jgi:hypothetical protein
MFGRRYPLGWPFYLLLAVVVSPAQTPARDHYDERRRVPRRGPDRLSRPDCKRRDHGRDQRTHARMTARSAEKSVPWPKQAQLK